MRSTVQAVLQVVVLGSVFAIGLRALEHFAGWPSSVRMFVGGGLVVVGSLLSSGGSGRALFEKAEVRATRETDISEYLQTKRANLSTGIRLFVIGGVLFVSLFIF